MRVHNINPESFLPRGHVVTEIKDGTLYMTTTQRLSTGFEREETHINHYVFLPEAYRLPVHIELTVKIDSPGLYLYFGNGHLTFGTPWSDNRRIDDIIEPSHKPRFFHNHIPMNEFVDISVICDFKAMQVVINGEERFYSTKEKYMKSELLKELNDKGFPLKITCSKRTELIIKSLSITEYDETDTAEIAGIMKTTHKDSGLPEPFITNKAIEPDEKLKFETCISLLPEAIQDEVIKTDRFLHSLKPMKFKRQIEKHGNKITYIAQEYGFSYAIHPSNDIMHHALSWYILTSSKPEFWHRKADMMETTLNRLAEDSPELAKRMFDNLLECIACSGSRCAVKTLCKYKGQKKMTCHGKMEFRCAFPTSRMQWLLSTPSIMQVVRKCFKNAAISRIRMGIYVKSIF